MLLSVDTNRAALPRKPRAPAASVLPPMAPAHYLRLRRKAAGLSVDQAAARMAVSLTDRREARDLIVQLEKEGARARYARSLQTLRRAFAFDLDVYRQLCNEPASRHPRICRGCGCSRWDPCDEDGDYCAWSTPGSCTRCAATDAALVGAHQ